MCFIGPFVEFNWSWENDHVAVNFPIAESPWEEIRIKHAQTAVDCAENYFIELEGMISNSSSPESNFFKRMG
jgi:hypothetical protein